MIKSTSIVEDRRKMIKTQKFGDKVQLPTHL